LARDGPPGQVWDWWQRNHIGKPPQANSKDSKESQKPVTSDMLTNFEENAQGWKLREEKQRKV